MGTPLDEIHLDVLNPHTTPADPSDTVLQSTPVVSPPTGRSEACWQRVGARPKRLKAIAGANFTPNPKTHSSATVLGDFLLVNS